MRFLGMASALVATLALFTACAGKSSDNNSTDNSAQPGASSSAMPAESAAPAGSPAAAPSGVPIYPGAVTQGSASYNGGANANGGSVQTAVMTTNDSFDKVYAFYQKNLPAAMEMMHTSTPPTPGAAFVVADPNNKGHTTTVVIATGADGKVTISIQTAQGSQ